MPDITVEIQVWCSCGAGLCDQTTTQGRAYRRDNESFVVEPCERCIDKAREEGYEKGYQEGLADGRQEQD